MRRPTAVFPALFLVLGLADRAAADVIVPSAFASTSGGAQSTVVFQSTARTYLCQVDSSQLGGLNVGDLITGMTFRFTSTSISGSLPATWNNFDIKLAQAANSVSNMSTTFASNMVNAVQVRSGVLSLATGAYPGGATTPTANPFGYVINFSTSYVYQGGDLVWQITHGANDSSFTSNLDAINASNSASGYGSLFRAYAAASDIATTGTASNFAVTKFITQVPVSAAPEPGTLILGGMATVCGGAGVWRRKRKKPAGVQSEAKSSPPTTTQGHA